MSTFGLKRVIPVSNGPWLTKSRFLAGKQCPERLWQQCHAPLEDGNGPAFVTEMGLDVGRLCPELSPCGPIRGWRYLATITQEVPSLAEAPAYQLMFVGQVPSQDKVIEYLDRRSADTLQ